MTRWTFLLSACLVLALAGCGDVMRAKPLAEMEINTFHDRFNAGKYHEIYDAADAAFKNATTEAQLTALLSAVHRKIGAVRSTANAGWREGTFNLTTQIAMQQTTTFEQGSATESFSFVISGSSAVLKGYNISSTDLIEK